MSISLCLIVRNESAYLRGCVESARPYVDDRVIIDTGSTDGTVDLAWDLATSFAEVPFNGDFSAARNEALSRAGGDWVLFLDADERLVPGEAEKLKALVEEADDGVLGFRLMRFNFFGDGRFYTGRELKLFRNLGGIEYRRKINESVAPSIAELGGRVEKAPVVFNHFGHCRSVAEREAKAYRYLSIMDDQLRDHPNDAVLLGYQALILRTLGRFAEAEERSARSAVIDPASATVWFFRGHVLRSLGQDGAALEAYDRGLALDPGNAAVQLMAGVQLTVLGDHAAAATAFRRARELDDDLLHTDINLGLLEQAAGRWDEAVARFTAAGRRNPGFFHDDLAARAERDPFRQFYAETILNFAGLGYHLGYCRLRAAGELPASGR